MEQEAVLAKSKAKPDYGQDVPDMVRDNLIIGVVLFAQGLFLSRWLQKKHTTHIHQVSLLSKVMLFLAGLCTLEGLGIIWNSRVAKLWDRDLLLNSLRLSGNEKILDLACGHGLLLVGAAKRLPQGRAVGVDLWSQVDQGKNTKDATLLNARLEGVEDRVEVHTADMRALPFPNNSFDVVVAHLAIHNIESAEGRDQATREIQRVLKPGGRIGIIDKFLIKQIANSLQQAGLQDVRISLPRIWQYFPSRTITGHK